MFVIKDLTGQRFGRHVVVSRYDQTKSGNTRWLCQCDCGNKRIVIGSALLNGKTKSCGCYGIERTKERNRTHGQSVNYTASPEHNAWSSMKRRCYKPKDNRYYRYGARGITVCKRWIHSFENFLKDMGHRPSPDHSLDRKRNNGNYTPSNCRWATDDIQRRNKSNNKWYTYKGEKMILQDWCKKYKFNRVGFYYYKKKKGWSDTKIIDFYVKRCKDII